MFGQQLASQIETLRDNQPYQAWRKAIELFSETEPDWRRAQIPAWREHFCGRYADRRAGHASFLLWDLVRQVEAEPRGQTPSAAGLLREDRWDQDLAVVHDAIARVGGYRVELQGTANCLFDAAFVLARLAIGLKAGLGEADAVELQAAIITAVGAYAGFWHGSRVSLTCNAKAAAYGTEDSQTFVAHQLSQITLVDANEAAQPALAIARCMVHHAAEWLLNTSSNPAREDVRRLPVLFVARSSLQDFGETKHGVLAYLEAQRTGAVESGYETPPLFYPDPVALGLSVLDDSWRRSFDRATKAAQRMLVDRVATGPVDAHANMAWRLRFHSHTGEPPPSMLRAAEIGGGSASGAAAALQVALARGLHLDAGASLTGEIDEQGRLHDVLGKEFKLEAAAATGNRQGGQGERAGDASAADGVQSDSSDAEQVRREWEIGLAASPVRVVLYGKHAALWQTQNGSGNPTEKSTVDAVAVAAAQDAAEAWWQGLGDKLGLKQVRPVADLQGAIELFTGEIEAMLGYLHGLVNAAERTPAYFPPGLKLPDVRVKVRVRTEPYRYDEAQARLDEQQHRAHPEEGRAYRHAKSRGADDDDEQPREEIVDWDTKIRPTLERGLVLADPGLGKTWLLKTESRVLAKAAIERITDGGSLDDAVLPCFLRLSDVADTLAWLKENGRPANLLDSVRHVLREQLAAEPVVTRLSESLGTRQCALLLDAWDEVLHDRKDALARCISDWLAQYHQTRLLMTSRLVGRPNSFWSTSRESKTDRELELQPFATEQTREFIERFFTSRPEIAGHLAIELQQAPQLRGLAETPLLLSFLCRYVYHQVCGEAGNGPSPTAAIELQAMQPNDLYEWIVTNYLRGVWHEGRQPAGTTDLSRLLPLLYHAAFNLLRTGKQQFKLDSFLDALRHAANELRGTQPGEDELARIEDLVVGREGLVIPAGEGLDPAYLFVHLTIQEYLAAIYLIRLNEQKPDAVHGILAELWDHPDFAEVWKLFALEGRHLPGHVDRMTETVLASADPDDEYLFRHYETALIWAGLAEWKHPASAARHKTLAWAALQVSLDQDIWARHVVLRALGRWNGQPFDRELWSAIVKRLGAGWDRDLITALASQAYRREVRAELIYRLSDENYNICYPALEILSSQVDHDEVRAELIARLADKNWYFPADAVEALASHAHHDEVRMELTARMADENGDVRMCVVRALASQAHRHEVRTELMARLADEDEDIRMLAAAALATQAHHDEVRTELMARLADEDEDIRAAAVIALATQAHRHDVRMELMARLADENGDVRVCVVQALETQAHRHDVRMELMARLADKDENVRERAVEVLASQANHDEVRMELMGRMADENGDVRMYVVRALSSQAHRHEVRTELMARLADEDEDIRMLAAAALATQAHHDEVRAKLIARLADEDQTVRMWAVDALSSEAHRHEVRGALLERLGDDDLYVRSLASDALSSEAHRHEVRGALLERLSDDDLYVRRTAIIALSSQAYVDKVRDALVERLGDDDLYVRFSASEALASQADVETVRAALLERLGDSDSDVRIAAIRALSSQAYVDKVRDALVERLEESIWCVRLAAIMALASQSHRHDVRTALLRRLNDSDQNVRRASARSLGVAIVRQKHRIG